MFETLRKVFGPVAVGIIIGSIALVFIFSGVFSPMTQGSRATGAHAAIVNGKHISFQEYNREYQQRLEFYQNLMKGKVDTELLEKMGLREQIMEKLVQQVLVLDEAERLGFTVADGEVADQISELPYFKKDGKFDANLYKQLLAQNRLSVSGFEQQVRDDLIRGHFVRFVKNQLKVRDDEVKNEYQISEDQRQVDYVVFSREQAAKKLKIDAKDLMAKTADILKFNKQQAEETLKKAKQVPVAALKAGLKKDGLEVKTSEKFNRLQGFVAGIGESAELLRDVFGAKNNLPKIYETNSNLVLVLDAKAFKPDSKEFDKKKDTYTNSVVMRKQQQIMDQWIGDLRAKAKLSYNEALMHPEKQEQ